MIEPKMIEPKKTLAQWENEARECNMDYGSYQYWIGLGKTFEELKAGAADRMPISHAKKRNMV